MLEELKDSLKHNIKERVSSPILGSYTIFFVAYHWKSLVVLFTSDSKGMELVHELESLWPGSWWSFVVPAFWTFLFLTIYPIIKLVYGLLLKRIHIFQLFKEQYYFRRETELKKERERMGRD